MATVKGQNLRVFIGDVVVAAAQQCDVSVRLNVKTSSTKDDEGDWGYATALALNWEVRTNGLVTIDPDRNDPASLLNRVGQTVRVELATAGGTKNSEMGEMLLAGNAIISDIQLSAQVDDESTYAVTLTGKKNMLTDLRLLVTSNGNYIRTSDGHLIAAPHEQQ